MHELSKITFMASTLLFLFRVLFSHLKPLIIHVDYRTTQMSVIKFVQDQRLVCNRTCFNYIQSNRQLKVIGCSRVYY